MGSYLYTPATIHIEPAIEPPLPQISPISRRSATPYYPPDHDVIILGDNISLDEKKDSNNDILTTTNERRSSAIDADKHKRNRHKKKRGKSRHHMEVGLSCDE